MSMLHNDGDSGSLLRLGELPALVVHQSTPDVRGWEILASDGRPLGRVSDLLVDPDRLLAEYLVVALSGDRSPNTGDETIVPLRALTTVETEQRLVPGEGMTPIRLRYRSTTYLMWLALAGVLILAMFAWAFDALSA